MRLLIPKERAAEVALSNGLARTRSASGHANFKKQKKFGAAPKAAQPGWRIRACASRTALRTVIRAEKKGDAEQPTENRYRSYGPPDEGRNGRRRARTH